MKINFVWSWKLTKLSKILLGVLGAVILAAASYFFYFEKNSLKGVISKIENKPVVDDPIYYAVQNNLAKIYIYDTQEKKNKKLLEVPLEKDFYRFGADYSAKNNQIIYSDKTGIWSYNLNDKSKSQLVANKPKTGEKESEQAEFYFNPKFSRDSGKIFFMVGYEDGPGSLLKYMNQDGKEITAVKDVFASTNSMRFTADGRFITRTGMDGSYFAVSSANDFSKTSAVDLTKKVEMIGDYDIDIHSGQTLIGGGSGDQKQNAMYSVKFDGTDFKKIADTSNMISGVLYDPYSGKTIFSQSDYQNKKGLGLFLTEGDKAVEYYKDGDKNITPKIASKDYIAASSNSFTETGFTLTNLFLVNKNDKSIISIGEASQTNFIGFIKSNRLPDGLSEVANLAPNDEEKAAFADSQKTHGYVNGTFYDYCWDYDCQSPTYPYSKLSASKMQEVINLSGAPLKLTGAVSIPVVYVYKDDPFTDEQIAILHDDANAKESFKKTENWMNKEMASRKKATTISFVNKGKVKSDSDCLTVTGTSKYYDSKCVKDAVVKTYGDLKDAPLVITVMMNMEGYINSRRQVIDETHSIYMVPINLSSSIKNIQSSTYFTDAQKAENISKMFTDWNNLGMDYSLKDILTIFGAKDKNATFKQPKDPASPGCFVDEVNSVMCNTNFNGQNNYKAFTEKVISPITKKEFGWYDADGDGVDEVDDKCPFDKENKC